MKSARREFGSGGRHPLSLEDWFRHLGWWVVWFIAQRSMHVWLAQPTGSRATPQH